VPCGPVNDIAAAFALADELGLGARVSVGEPGDAVDLVANPITLSKTPPTYRRRPPRLGEHTDELLRSLKEKP
jgi:crotonobetainyl-CoA:carnitine CoA-transferase CaiB-like acyl-CoA transferase